MCGFSDSYSGKFAWTVRMWFIYTIPLDDEFVYLFESHPWPYTHEYNMYTYDNSK